jgi:glycosyltransferase involved in cell wall biosynthesis
MSIELVAAIERAGVDVIHNGSPDKTASHVMFMAPPQRPEGWFKGQHVSLLTMWESTQLAMEHLATVPLFDHLFVPSEQNLEMFSKVNPNTTKFGLGCDYDTWSITPRVKSDPFTIITAGKGGRRKGIDTAIKVFKRFRDGMISKGFPRPRLLIKSSVTMANSDPDIFIVDEEMTDAEEAKFYAQGHVYLGLSRGEGWGMIPHQTIAQAMPTILSNAHGHAEFAHYAMKVKCGLIPAETDIVGRSGDWWEPDEDMTLQLLNICFNDYETFAANSVRHAENIRKEFTWDKAAMQILAHLPKVQNKKIGKWVEAPQTYLTMWVTQPIDCNIGSGTYNFVPGEKYQVTADVKRVLFDAGYVDSECLDPFEKATYIKPKPTYIDEEAA